MRALAATLLATTILASTSANAAVVEYRGQKSGIETITITGEIVNGDAEQFRQIASGLTGPTLVLLSSPGGLVVEGLIIGEAISQAGFSTGVARNNTCASVCAFIWLAGKQRFLSETSKIGFHAAYNADDGSESGQANALVGAYLANLGLSYSAVTFVTESSPTDMKWLHPEDADRVGIAYTLVPDTSPGEEQNFSRKGSAGNDQVQQKWAAPPPASTAAPANIPAIPREPANPVVPNPSLQVTTPTQAPPAAPIAPPSPSRALPALNIPNASVTTTNPSTREARAIQTVVDMYAYWSQGGTNIEGLARYYSSVVDFFGKPTAREKVMADKRKFSIRWPERHYTADPKNLAAHCETDGKCTVTGSIDWDCASTERGEHSVGTAQISDVVSDGMIISEGGSVVSGHKEPIAGRAIATTSSTLVVDTLGAEFLKTYRTVGTFGLSTLVQNCYDSVSRQQDYARCLILDMAGIRLDSGYAQAMKCFPQCGTPYFAEQAFKARMLRYLPPSGLIKDEDIKYLTDTADAVVEWRLSHPTFVEGMRAREEYEHWYTSLPPTSFRDGAEYWTSNRSLRVTPTCSSPDASWQYGCAEAKKRLDPSDVLRKTDPIFRLGWNSL